VAAHVGTPTPKAQIQKETQSKPRLSLADMPPAASSTAAIKLIRDFKSRPLIQTIFPSFCGALDIGHGSRPRSPIAAAFTIVAGLIAVNHPTLTTFDIGLFAWEGEVQPRFAQHAPWWLVPGAFGGNLFASTAYVARIAVYTLIFGLIAMGNTQGVGIGAQVASLAMAGAYGTALVLTHRPPVSLFASFYYVAIAVAAVANASFFIFPVGDQLHYLIQRPSRVVKASRGTGDTQNDTTAAVSASAKSLSMSVSSPPPSPPELGARASSRRTSTPRRIWFEVPTTGNDNCSSSATRESHARCTSTRVSLARRLEEHGACEMLAVLQLEAEECNHERQQLEQILKRERLERQSRLKMAGTRTVTARFKFALWLAASRVASPHAGGNLRVPVAFGALVFTNICLHALAAKLLLIDCFQWMNRFRLDLESALAPMAYALATDSIGLRVASPLTYNALEVLLTHIGPLVAGISICFKASSIAGLVLSALLCFAGSCASWEYYTHTYEIALQSPKEALRKKYIGMERWKALLLLSSHIGLSIAGMVLVVLTANILGVLVYAVINDGPIAYFLRRQLAFAITLFCAATLIVRPLLVPYFHLQRCGPATFVLSAWHLPYYFWAGAIRLGLLFAVSLFSFFEPCKATLPSPLDAYDTGRASFLAYCLEHVESQVRASERPSSPQASKASGSVDQGAADYAAAGVDKVSEERSVEHRSTRS